MYGIAICYLSMCASTVLKQNCVLQIPTMNLKCLFAFPSVLKTPKALPTERWNRILVCVLYWMKYPIFMTVSLIVAGLLRE